MLGSPCKNCQKRQIGCHDRCPEYLEYKRLNDEKRTKMQKERAEFMAVVESNHNRVLYMSHDGAKISEATLHRRRARQNHK